MDILLKIVIKKIKRMRKIGSDISRELDGLEKLHIFPFFSIQFFKLEQWKQILFVGEGENE